MNPKTKKEARETMRALLSRANRSEVLADSGRAMSMLARRTLLRAADDYRAEIESIRRLLPSMPE